MGLLVDGVWQDRWYDTAKSGGRFIRSESQFRSWITPDGSPGPSGAGGFVAEPDRYHQLNRGYVQDAGELRFRRD